MGEGLRRVSTCSLDFFSRKAIRDCPPTHQGVGDREKVELPCVGCGRLLAFPFVPEPSIVQ